MAFKRSRFLNRRLRDAGQVQPLPTLQSVPDALKEELAYRKALNDIFDAFTDAVCEQLRCEALEVPLRQQAC